ncbi:MAG: class I SAM-dependent methyltransferase [Anaerolineales bacterium]
MNATLAYYDALAKAYHLLYRDWEATLEREGMLLRRWFKDRDITTVLDASCGTGTQAIALAQIGYRVLASDPSSGMLEQAQRNAATYDLSDRIRFLQAGFLDIAQMVDAEGGLDAILTKGDAFPHLTTDAEIETTLHGFYNLLRPGGTLLIGMRDFEPLIHDRPRFLPRYVHDPAEAGSEQIIVFEIWDWDEGPPLTVTVNHFIVSGTDDDDYRTQRYPVKYRALTADEVQVVLLEAGFNNIEIIHDRAELVILGTKPV